MIIPFNRGGAEAQGFLSASAVKNKVVEMHNFLWYA